MICSSTTEIDAYEGILGSSKVDRHVAKFWINASFGNSTRSSKNGQRT
jgi:hypothetical protein